MAGRFEATTEINRPIEEVFGFLADGENDRKFSARIVEISKTTDGPPGVGTVYASTAKDAGLTMKHEFELTEFDPPNRIRWKELTKHPIVVTEGGYDLSAADEGTRLRFFNDLQGRGIGVLLAGLALRSARKGADAFAAAIKQAVESS
jgi:hypothetical protein